MTLSVEAEKTIVAAKRAQVRSQYRVSINPAGILEINRHRVWLEKELTRYVKRFGKIPEAKPKVVI